MKNFKNKIVVITGAASGMGKAYATAFAKLGSKLALNDYDKSALTTSPEKIVKHVIKCIRKKQFKIVYGRDSFRAWIAGNFLPKRFLKIMLHHEMKTKLKY